MSGYPSGYSADRVKGGDAASRRARAILLLSAGIGGLSLARAVNDKALSREILAALRDQLIALTKQPLPQRARAEGPAAS
jgi:hypothetical protein